MASPIRRRWLRNWIPALVVANILVMAGTWLVAAVERARNAARAATTI